MPIDLATLAANIGVAVAAGAAYVSAGYGRNKAEYDDEFDPYRAAATLLLTVALGILATLLGVPVTQEYVMTQIPAYMGVIYLIQKVLRAIAASGVLPIETAP